MVCRRVASDVRSSVHRRNPPVRWNSDKNIDPWEIHLDASTVNYLI